MKKIAVLNNKGGVGKSTMATSLAHGLAILGNKVLLWDTDGQNNCALFLGIANTENKNSFYDFLDRRYPKKINDCIMPNVRDNLDLLITNNSTEIDAELHREPRIDLVLKEKLNGLDNMDYDVIIIDCGPSRTKMNDAVLCYVDKIIMPVQLEAAALAGIGGIYDYLKDLRLSPDIIGAVVPNMFDVRTKDSKENLNDLKKFFEGENLIVTEPVHRRVKITEAGKMGKTVFEYDKEAGEQIFKVLESVVTLIG